MKNNAGRLCVRSSRFSVPPRTHSAQSRSGGRQGAAVLLVLVLTFIMFSLLSLALSATCRLHEQNRKMLKELQARADRLEVTPKGGRGADPR
jgi:hypothetical protein